MARGFLSPHVAMLSNLLFDIRYAARLLTKNRWFTAAAVASLALGIGANTAIFSVVNAVLIRPLPFHEADRLVVVWGDDHTTGHRRGQVSFTDVADVRSENRVFEEVATFMSWQPTLSGDGEPQRVAAMQIADGYFDVLKASPVLGRLFEPGDQVDGSDFVVVLGYGFWQSRFGGDPNVIGRTISLNSRSYTVVGVLGPDVSSLPTTLVDAPADLYRPVAEPYEDSQRDARHLRAVARLRPGVDIASAQAELDVIARRLAGAYPDQDTAMGFRVVSLGEDTVGDVRTTLVVLLAAVAFVLLIACANVGNLLLSRTIARRKEIAIRATLGAGAWRLARQTLVESLVLGLLGGGVGLLLAVWSTTLLTSLGAEVMPSLTSVEIDRPVLAFTIAVSILAGLAFGAAPALYAARPDLEEALRSGGRTSTSAHGGRLRGALVVAEVALALVLLACAGLLLRSVAALRGVDPGFDSANVLTMNVSLPSARYNDGPAIAGFLDRLLDRIATVPGVETAGATSVLPVSRNFDRRGIRIEGRVYGPGEEPSIDAYFVTSDYLRALSIPVLDGRGLARGDTADAPGAALVSASMAREQWPGENAIGKRFRFPFDRPGASDPWFTVVGVVSDVRQKALDASPKPAFYVPVAQFPISNLTMVVRTTGDPRPFAGEVRREVIGLDPNLAVFDVATMDDVLSESIAVRRFATLLLGAFAAVALVLAAVGIYGVLSYAVSQRTREIGVRMAFGARGSDVVRLVAGHGLRLAISGVAIGLALAFAATRTLASLLFGVTATDLVTFAATAGVLLGVALLASVVPAIRAARTDPIEALRSE